MKNFHKNLHLITTILITYSITMFILWLFATFKNYIDEINSIAGTLCGVGLIFMGVGAISIVYSICHPLWHIMCASTNCQKILQTYSDNQIIETDEILKKAKAADKVKTKNHYDIPTVIIATIVATFCIVCTIATAINNHPQIAKKCELALTHIMIAGWFAAATLFMLEIVVICFNTYRLMVAAHRHNRNYDKTQPFDR